MRPSQVVVAVGTCVVLAVRVLAVETPKQAELDLEALLDEATQNNAGLQAAHHAWQSAAHYAKGADALPDPRLGYAYFIDEVETRVGPQQQKFSLSQQVPWFGTLGSRARSARDRAAALERRVEDERLRVVHEVKQAFYELYYLGRAIAITRDNIQLLNHLESVAQARYKTGAPVSSVIQAQVELGLLEDRLASLLELHEPTGERLRAALNRDDDTEIPIPDRATFHRVTLDEEGLLAGLDASSPGLQAMDANVRAETAAMDLVRKQNLPSVSFGLEYIDTGESRVQPVADSGKDAVIAQVSLNLPVWLGRNRSAVREAGERRLAAELARDQVRNRLQADLSHALYAFRDADRKVRLYDASLIPQARQALGVAEESYRAGAVDFLNLIDAQRRYLEFQLELERARVDREIRLAEIEILAGTEVSKNPFVPTEE